MSIFLDDPDFLFSEIVEVVDQAVDPAVGGVDLALEVCPFMVRPGGVQLLMKVNDLGQMLSLCQKCAQRFAILGVEELAGGE